MHVILCQDHLDKLCNDTGDVLLWRVSASSLVLVNRLLFSPYRWNPSTSNIHGGTLHCIIAYDYNEVLNLENILYICSPFINQSYRHLSRLSSRYSSTSHYQRVRRTIHRSDPAWNISVWWTEVMVYHRRSIAVNFNLTSGTIERMFRCQVGYLSCLNIGNRKYRFHVCISLQWRNRFIDALETGNIRTLMV